MSSNWNGKLVSDAVMKAFRLRNLPVSVKYYNERDALLSLSSVQVDQSRQCVPCLAVGRAAKMGAAVGVLLENFNYDYCRTVNGFMARDDKWRSAAPFVDRWNSTEAASRAHHEALIPMRAVEGFAAAPIESDVIEDPDACVLFATPEQAFWILASLINTDYKKLTFTFVGESNCNDAWIKTIMTGEPGIGIGSYGERSYAGLAQDELMISLKPAHLLTVLEGAEKMRNGRERLCYPVIPFGLVGDIGAVKNTAFEGY